MKKLLLILMIPFLSFGQDVCSNFNDYGIVIKEDVCGLGNAIIKTSDGWYIAAEHYGGTYLYEGDYVCGDLKTYGFEDVYSPSRNAWINFYIEDYEVRLSSAYDELCD